MRWLACYLRQCFCSHDFEKEEALAEKRDGWGNTKRGLRVSLLCKKCGYHRSFWKF